MSRCSRLSVLFTFLLLLTATSALAQTPTLILSEYIDGPGNDNAIEVFNGTSAPIHLGDYFIRIRLKDQPGVMLTAQLQAGTMLASGDSWVLVDDNASPAVAALADQFSTLVEFNGDDAITLSTWDGSTYTTVDSFGQWDVDPGDFWDCVGGDTQSVTMRRKFEVCSGDPIDSDPFDPCLEWDFYSFGDFSGAGTHTAYCLGTVAVQPESWGAVKADFR